EAETVKQTMVPDFLIPSPAITHSLAVPLVMESVPINPTPVAPLTQVVSPIEEQPIVNAPVPNVLPSPQQSIETLIIEQHPKEPDTSEVGVRVELAPEQVSSIAVAGKERDSEHEVQDTGRTIEDAETQSHVEGITIEAVHGETSDVTVSTTTQDTEVVAEIPET
ncbi:hypothetical protein KI387_015508, partial [Taxus chinensis]